MTTKTGLSANPDFPRWFQGGGLVSQEDWELIKASRRRVTVFPTPFLNARPLPMPPTPPTLVQAENRFARSPKCEIAEAIFQKPAGECSSEEIRQASAVFHQIANEAPPAVIADELSTASSSWWTTANGPKGPWKSRKEAERHGTPMGPFKTRKEARAMWNVVP